MYVCSCEQALIRTMVLGWFALLLATQLVSGLVGPAVPVVRDHPHDVDDHVRLN